MTSGTKLLFSSSPYSNSTLILFFTSPSKPQQSTYHCGMKATVPPPANAEHMCSAVASGTIGTDAGLNGVVEQEESSFMESPKRGSTEWTDEKHSLYLKSMEASFVDQLYNSLDTRNWQIEDERSSDSMSLRKIHASSHCPSHQFKVLQLGFWSRIDFKRDNLVDNEANGHNVASSNPWIQHFRNINKQGAIESLEKPSLTSCSNAEMIDQNFVEEDSEVQMMNTACSKKRKSTYNEHDLQQEEEEYVCGSRIKQ